jgi:membrane protein
LKRAGRRWNEDDGGLIAAAVSYYASLSLFPLLLVLISVLGMLFRFSGWGHDTQTRLLELVSAETSERLARQVGALLGDIQSKALVSGPIGVVTLLMTAMALFLNFERAFDRIWRRRLEPRGLLTAARRVLFHRLRAFLMLLGLGLLVLAAFAANIAVSSVESALWSFWGAAAAWRTARLLVSLTLNCLLFTMLYRTLPKAPVPWRGAAQGGLLVALTWEVGRLILSAILISDKYGAYGIVGAFIAILLWTYYASAVVLFGAQYVWVACDELKASGDTQDR